MDKREMILGKTLKLFEHRGYYGLSVAEIADACGIARGSLYSHFDSKQDLVNALYIHWKKVLLEYVQTDLHLYSGREKHKKLWSNLVSYAAEHPYALSFLESQQHATYLSEEAIAIEVAVNKFAETTYCEIMDMSEIKPQVMEILLSVTYGGYVQLAKMSKLGQISLDDTNAIRIEEVMWNVIQMQNIL